MSSSPRNMLSSPPPPPHLDIGEPSVSQSGMGSNKSPESPFMRSKSQRGNVTFRADAHAKAQGQTDPDDAGKDDSRSSDERNASDESSLPGGDSSQEGPSSSKNPLNPTCDKSDGDDGQTGMNPLKSPRLAMLRNAFSPNQQQSAGASPAAGSGSRGGDRSMRESADPR